MIPVILIYCGMVLFTFALTAAFNDIDEVAAFFICCFLGLIWPITLILVAGATTAQLLKRLDK